MNKIILAVCLILTAASFGAAQTAPKFSAYNAPKESFRAINVNLKSHKNARMYRTNLRNAAKDGVNFAGHFVLTGWGCGTNCMEWGLVDARNGQVFFPTELQGIGIGFCELPKNSQPADAPKQEDPEYPDPVVFKPNSRLLELNGFTGGGLDSKNSKCGTYFFEWNGARLKRIKLIPGKRI